MRRLHLPLHFHLHHLLLLLVATPLVSAGCWQRRLCCPGRNTTCKATDDGISHLPMQGAFAGRHNQFQRLRERHGLGTTTTTTQEPWQMPHYEGSGDDVRLVYPDVYDSEHHEKIGHLIMPDIIELEGSGANMIYNKYGSGSDEHMKSPTTTRPTSSPVRMFKHLVFGKEAGPDTPPEDILRYQERPRHLLIRYSVLQHHIPLTVSTTTVPLEDEPQLMYLEAPEIECYCDEECVKLGDCCSDYTYVCPPQDCLVDHWAGWQPCVPDQGFCGMGVQRRDRRVRAYAERGGAECPPLVEMRTCWKECGRKGFDDITTVALLIDYKYNKTRGTKKRNTVYWDLPEVSKKIKNAKYYCVEYELGWVNKNCVNKAITKRLFTGNRICAECQPEAQIHRKSGRCASDLDDGESGFWKLIGPKSCNGIWTRIARTDDCRCGDDRRELDPFLLV